MGESSTTSRRRGRFGRLRPRLHWFTWLVVLLAATAMTIIVVPGELDLDSALGAGLEDVVTDRKPRQWTSIVVQKFDHGWPVTFLSRAIGYGATRPPRCASVGEVYWLRRDHWPLGSDAHRVDAKSLAIDAAAAALIVLLAGAVCEIWIRRRGGRLRVRVLDVLVATSVVACALGWRSWHLGQQRDELAAAHQISSRPGFMARTGGPLSQWSPTPAPPFDLPLLHYTRVENKAPAWLRRLAGGESQVPSFRHVTALAMDPSKVTESSWQSVRAMPYLEELGIYGPLSEGTAKELQRLSALRRLILGPGRQTAADSVRGRLRRAQDLHYVALVPQLESLVINSVDLPAASLERLTALPRLQKLEINCNFTPNQLARYEEFAAAHPELDVEIYWGFQRPRDRR